MSDLAYWHLVRGTHAGQSGCLARQTSAPKSSAAEPDLQAVPIAHQTKSERVQQALAATASGACCSEKPLQEAGHVHVNKRFGLPIDDGQHRARGIRTDPPQALQLRTRGGNDATALRDGLCEVREPPALFAARGRAV